MKFQEKSRNIITVPHYQNCFVYFLLLDDEVVYVGQTKNGLIRPFSHKNKHFDTVKILYCDASDLDITEDVYIQKYKPVYNKQRNYEIMWGLARVRDNIRRQTDYTNLTIPKLKKALSRLNTNPQIDIYTGKPLITFDEYKTVLNYFKENKQL